MPFTISLGSFGGHTGSSPSPFDAIDGTRLAGPDGSHPLHSVIAGELVRPSSGPLTGEIALDRQAVVGEGITGSLRIRAIERVEGRKAALRLVGLRLDEVRRSESDTDIDDHTTSSDSWVETSGQLFIQDAFREPVIPATLEPGQMIESRFGIPAPRLGPPSAHLGESIIAWALEVRWDVPHRHDHFVAAFLPLAQHPDLIRAGVGKQGGMSLVAGYPVGDAEIGVTSPLPAPAGTDLVVSIRWPSAPGGPRGRVELHRMSNAPNGVKGVIASEPIDPGALRGGLEARLPIPVDSAPSFDGAGLELAYVIRVLVDRRFRSDAAIERPVAIV
jgi:hypothetical protein